MADYNSNSPSRVPAATPSSSSPNTNRRRMSTEASAYRILNITDDEMDAVIETFEHVDDNRSKTMSRLLVENYLSKWAWYNPQKNKKNGPSLAKAYAYYEHITLPRHFSGGQSADHILRRAEPGETEPTELYSFITTPSSAFIEWGIGVDLYFSSLRLMALAVLIAGLINIPNIMFYASTEYSANGQDMLREGSYQGFSLVGSAVCTTGEWRACPNCKAENFDFEQQSRLGVGVNEISGQEVILVQQNACNGATLPQGSINMITLAFLSIFMGLTALYLRARAIRFDEDKVTSTDYSVVVKNPPPDAFHPDEWKHFFEQFSAKQVTAVTIALNNDDLLRRLIWRRQHKDNLRRMLPRGTDMEDEDIVRAAVAHLLHEQESDSRGCCSCFIGTFILPILRLFGMMLPANVLVDKIFTLTDEIKELQKKKYKVVKVFVTFESEEGQRAALSSLAVGRIDALMNNIGSVPSSAAFHGVVLKVGEPPEPSAVRWLDLGASTLQRNIPRLINFVLTVGIIAICGYAVAKTRENPNLGPRAAGPLVTCFNAVVPQALKLLMLFEKHATEGSYQKSLYLKITFFRWVNTAILFKMITPFTSTVSPGLNNIFPLLPSVNSLLWSELWLTPTLRLIDWFSNLKKHVLAPRFVLTQDQMNMYFQGTYYNLGERYTDLTKILFLCFFYSALYPATFLFAAAILTVQYYADKWCLLRIWGWTATIGPEVSRFSVRYFFSGALLAFCLVSAFAWAQFPYDNLCDLDNPQGGFAGNYTNVVLADGSNRSSVTVEGDNDNEVSFCSQSWRDVAGFPFPPTSDIQPLSSGMYWMSDSQSRLCDVYGWFSVAYLAGFLVFLFGASSLAFFFSWFRGVYSPRGQEQHIDFSSNAEIFGYVPQIKLVAFPFPFLACDIDEVDQGLIGWNDPTRSYDHYNLIFDVPWPGMKRSKMTDENTRLDGDAPIQEEFIGQNSAAGASGESSGSQSTNRIFSTVKHYPPDWLKKIYEDETAISRTQARSVDVAKQKKRSL